MQLSVTMLSGSVFAQLGLQTCALVGTKMNIKFDLMTIDTDTVNVSFNYDPDAPLVPALIDNEPFDSSISKKVFKVSTL
jgi:hypothetical protein